MQQEDNKKSVPFPIHATVCLLGHEKIHVILKMISTIMRYAPVENGQSHA